MYGAGYIHFEGEVKFLDAIKFIIIYNNNQIQNYLIAVCPL